MLDRLLKAGILRGAVASAALAIGVPALGSEEAPPMGTEERPIVLKRAPPGIPVAEFTIRNGILTDPALYPGVLHFLDLKACTGTLIGARVLITAAHCLANGSIIDVPKRAGSDDTVKGQCDHAPAGDLPIRVDMALCLLRSPVETVYETLNIRESRPRAKETVTILGFGCPEFGQPDPDRPILRRGNTTVMRTPDGQSSAFVTAGGASLCTGDSGGAAFLPTPGGSRLFVGVHMEVDAIDQAYHTSVSAPPAATFIRDWVHRNGQTVCGIDAHATGCR